MKKIVAALFGTLIAWPGIISQNVISSIKFRKKNRMNKYNHIKPTKKTTSLFLNNKQNFHI